MSGAVPAAHAVPVAAIWAQDREGVLGSGTAMLWHVPADFAHFKMATMGCPVLMGRASWEALGRPLPGRLNVVMTRTPGYSAEGAVVVPSLSEALDVCQAWASEHGAPRVWVAGGGKVYVQAMDVVDELVVTDLDLAVGIAPGAPVVRAPHIDPALWTPDLERTDAQWREASGDARWKVTTYVRR